ncbi:GAP family protein [Streptomyces sp. NPDC017556]|uniref:GAP family protein n=1 Tax=Streptomyces sp. NPDC017556 TaxID=3365002 RepID=UPI00378C0E92
MGTTLGQVLAPAVGIAISPVPIIAVVLMPTTPRARVNGIAFTLAWVVTLAVLSTVVVLLGSGAGGHVASWVSWVKAAAGGLRAAGPQAVAAPSARRPRGQAARLDEGHRHLHTGPGGQVHRRRDQRPDPDEHPEVGTALRPSRTCSGHAVPAGGSAKTPSSIPVA